MTTPASPAKRDRPIHLTQFLIVNVFSQMTMMVVNVAYKISTANKKRIARLSILLSLSVRIEEGSRTLRLIASYEDQE
jgi:hypothetical protein